ncbi:hypothetical protein Tco_0014526 [Tanacetum coccineum]
MKGCFGGVRLDGLEEHPLGALGEEEVVVGEGVVATSSSLEMLTNNCLGGIMGELLFFEGVDKVSKMVQFHELELDIQEHQSLPHDGCERTCPSRFPTRIDKMIPLTGKEGWFDMDHP